ncbi:hypothetical protein [Nissabacter sp. SGAir0207]|uniref:hypothetical protein n=1 Tax=Nissabacter sp. SGAir0207 TaxID=2126321 RepID=UPI00143CC851|nr:hypothetical protein [Nissabacter sp. SGAir0207]
MKKRRSANKHSRPVTQPTHTRPRLGFMRDMRVPDEFNELGKEEIAALFSQA